MSVTFVIDHITLIFYYNTNNNIQYLFSALSLKQLKALLHIHKIDQ